MYYKTGRYTLDFEVIAEIELALLKSLKGDLRFDIKSRYRTL
jgi:hypothetical protein